MWHVWFLWGWLHKYLQGNPRLARKAPWAAPNAPRADKSCFLPPHHTWKSLTLLASTEAATPVVYKTQTSHLPQKKSQEVKSSRVISPFYAGFSAGHCVFVGFIPEIQVWRHWQPPLSAELWPTVFHQCWENMTSHPKQTRGPCWI